MTEATQDIISAAMRHDSVVTPEMATAIIAIYEHGLQTQPAPAPMDSVLSREKVAAVIGVTPATVDYYGRKGYIRRVSITGKQAQGYSEQSVREAMRKNAARKIGNKWKTTKQI